MSKRTNKKFRPGVDSNPRPPAFSVHFVNHFGLAEIVYVGYFLYFLTFENRPFSFQNRCLKQHEKSFCEFISNFLRKLDWFYQIISNKASISSIFKFKFSYIQKIFLEEIIFSATILNH